MASNSTDWFVGWNAEQALARQNFSKVDCQKQAEIDTESVHNNFRGLSPEACEAVVHGVVDSKHQFKDTRLSVQPAILGIMR
eukprot:768536-Hanusia_phi.AAC.15